MYNNFVDYTDAHTDHIRAHTYSHTHMHTHTHIHTHMHTYSYTEPSLTLDTLSSVLDGAQHLDGLDDLRGWLQIPDSKGIELQQQYDNRQLPRAFSTVFLTENPSPSWNTVAHALWEMEELGALEVVQKLYLKGEPCIDTQL